jgi:hypothetical protein
VKIIGKVLPLALALGCAPAWAAVITFDDLGTRDNFWAQGIANNYQGYVWSPSLTGPATSETGWASATVGSPAWDPAPTPVSGQSYAWNWNGPQSLFIHFGTATDVNSVWLATLSSTFGGNASTVQLFGYDATDTLVATGSVMNLTDSFQLYTADFAGIYKVELRGSGGWFSVDDITLNATSAPEPSSAALLALGGLAVAGLKRFRSKK